MAQIARGYLKLHLKKVFFKILNIFLFFLFYMLKSIYFIIIIFFFLVKVVIKGAYTVAAYLRTKLKMKQGPGYTKKISCFQAPR